MTTWSKLHTSSTTFLFKNKQVKFLCDVTVIFLNPEVHSELLLVANPLVRVLFSHVGLVDEFQLTNWTQEWQTLIDTKQSMVGVVIYAHLNVTTQLEWNTYISNSFKFLVEYCKNPSLHFSLSLSLSPSSSLFFFPPSSPHQNCSKSPSHLTSGSGSLTFKLVNMRADYIFALLRGGKGYVPLLYAYSLNSCNLFADCALVND